MRSDFRFCPVCAAPLEPRVLRVGEPTRLVCTSTACGHVLYLDPKLAVGTIIRTTEGEAGAQIVMVRRAIEPGYGKWVFPGGYVDRGEEVQSAALREAREECGLEVRLDRFVGVYSYPGVTAIIIVYAATAIGGTLAVDDEGLEAQTFDYPSIPWHELAFRSTGDALKDYGAGINSTTRS